ncbi:Glycosidase [Ignavibacterium album JCM 16511]|uniref:Glycosidase n=1 Tax=Ignavibacterium album (strain DSM 19864 / JCM 16511 / NBRC 101810 / Mat9-16) TaxID=945713 RepID=I0ANT0_IGNAJ|nr:alpha-amylase family glycosyl hydrolase [Ignavibacterium album]AFH50637.1 Glycosidase [Ignavibacterium album JCM 16511]
MNYNNPRILEINTRVWLKKKKLTSVAEISESQIDEWKDLGFDYIWLMGIWKTNKDIVAQYCFEPDLVNSYTNALKDWKTEDVIGSPYSIDCYEINPELGSEAEILQLRERLNKKGIKLILDFVSNHLSIGSCLVKEKKEIFLPADEYLFRNDPYTFFKSPYNSKEYFAHGRDPLFPPWKDTIQINFYSNEARNFLIETLHKISSLSDGVRCDMAMLSLNNIFYNTWIGALKKYGFEKPENEFWSEAINAVKSHKPEFIFIAEAYWDLEWQLQQLGFDFTYDKRLLDRLAGNDIKSVKDHLHAEKEFQQKSVRFIENHDEDRAAAKFGKDKSLAAATIISTIQGMILYYDGQFEGKKTKLPVQLGREPFEKEDDRIKNYYYKLLRITKHSAFRKGEWIMLDPIPAAPSDYSFENILIWQWKYENHLFIVAVNYANTTSRCRVKFKAPENKMIINLNDILNSVSYERSVEEINERGLYIELKAYSSHIFSTSI